MCSVTRLAKTQILQYEFSINGAVEAIRLIKGGKVGAITLLVRGEVVGARPINLCQVRHRVLNRDFFWCRAAAASSE
ncbi:MAG: hypothetical protein F6K04_03875 [Leptolyngbya sp. SIO4C5]|nr:hypothetical protein [Leptolyngbya sp. SIO4C5]